MDVNKLKLEHPLKGNVEASADDVGRSRKSGCSLGKDPRSIRNNQKPDGESNISHHPTGDHDPKDGHSRADQNDSHCFKGLNVLLAEDGIINQKLVVSLLTKWGHRVTIAENGQKAIQLWRRSNPSFDLILMDVLMPIMNGLDATIEIRKQEKEIGNDRPIPIVALTAQAIKGDRQRCLAAGMDDYISKPLRKKELESTLKKLQP